jgi:hypothetical protein
MYYITPLYIYHKEQPNGRLQKFRMAGTGDPIRRPPRLSGVTPLKYDEENSRVLVETRIVVPDDWQEVTQQWVEENYPGVL